MPTAKAHGLQVMKMCQVFVKKGVSVELVTGRRFHQLSHANPFIYYNIKERFKIKKIFSIDLIPLQNIIGRLGLWTQSLSFAILAGFYLLFQKTDIIYSRDLFSLFFLSWFKSNLIYEAHTFPKHFFLYKYIFKKVKAIIVITQNLKNFFIERGISGDKILVAPDGVDLGEFNISQSQEQCRKNLNLSMDKKIILYTGHLFKWKGVSVLAEAGQYLDKNCLIIFVGGLERDVENFKSQVSGFKNISVLGHQPHSQIPYYLKAADVLVLPNSAKVKISEYWTSPMKMFEYMASQRPIVASDLPSIREVLNENNAVLVGSDSPADLARGIEKVLKNPNFSVKIARQTFEDVKKYTWEKRAQSILEFIKI